MKNDIYDLHDIKILIDSFYGEVQKDTLIGGIFHGAVQNWPVHLEKMYTFWQTVLLGKHTYSGSPFSPHAQMQLDTIHFERWLYLWSKTIDTYFEGETAEEAKWRAEKMASLFLIKIEHLRNQGSKSLT
ncbi:MULTISPECIES: group III truncated hemoglobin [Elizabethkingia]|jgi:hemoglobin|uniref:Group 3 truncated hemoglobin ctb n=1 Tax=Elizabethkingia anophelis TaxID=1117645 RepID=A0A7Z7LZ70_9FLAO|nr:MULTISPECIES: group III truncated hemoglobin [Elizabethkingia]MDV3586628.1 globin [Elizabethkingia anophelis]MDV3622513.1 globin [Elizabethkingia anophelis]MDV3670460.1 globin [Elizabethkingia anophelis]MDV3680906.1 globin [Elizabethkingia anophelis]MDV3695114.1 globin [Elizabethkingia anophelis]